MDRQLERAKAHIVALVKEHPALKLNPDGHNEPVFQGGTHRILLGTYEDMPVVFKCFSAGKDGPARKAHEKAALELYWPTQLVPRLFPLESEMVLVLERLPGLPMFMAEENLTDAETEALYRQVGGALARIVHTAPGANLSRQDDIQVGAGFDYGFYRNADLPTLYAAVIETSARVLADENIREKATLQSSLTALEKNQAAILAYPSFLQMDDVHTANIMVASAALQGFIDLEMTRCGNEVLLLAAALVMCGERHDQWSWLRAGYEEIAGCPLDETTLRLARIAMPFSQWIRIMWYWTASPDDFLYRLRMNPVRDIVAITEMFRIADL